MVARVLYRQRCRARADFRYVELDVRVGKEMLFDNNGEVDVDGKAENFTKRRVLRSGCDTFQQEIPANDLDWVLVRVLRAS
jgi:hypothetical protein